MPVEPLPFAGSTEMDTSFHSDRTHGNVYLNYSGHWALGKEGPVVIMEESCSELGICMANMLNTITQLAR